MKKILLIASVILGLGSVAFAQEKGKVELGFNVGYNSAYVSDSENSSDSRSGFNFGAMADYYFSNRWSIKAKLIYDQKGWDNGILDDLDTGSRYETNYELTYLTVPVMANWHFGKKRNWYLNFGPYAGFLLSAEDSRFGIDLKDGFKPVDFGLAFGIGVKIPVSDKLKISLEYDGQSGFTDVFEENDYSAVTNARGAFNVGIVFLMK